MVLKKEYNQIKKIINLFNILNMDLENNLYPKEITFFKIMNNIIFVMQFYYI